MRTRLGGSECECEASAARRATSFFLGVLGEGDEGIGGGGASTSIET